MHNIRSAFLPDQRALLLLHTYRRRGGCLRLHRSVKVHHPLVRSKPPNLHWFISERHLLFREASISLGVPTLVFLINVQTERHRRTM